MPHQKPDIRKQSYLGWLDAHFTGKTGGVHIWVSGAGGGGLRRRASRAPRNPPCGLPVERHGGLRRGRILRCWQAVVRAIPMDGVNAASPPGAGVA